MIYKYLCIVILEMIVKQFVVGCYYHVNGVDLMVCPCILFLFCKFPHFRPTELLLYIKNLHFINLFYKNISIHIVSNNQKYHNIKFVSINSKSSIHYDLPLCCSWWFVAKFIHVLGGGGSEMSSRNSNIKYQTKGIKSMLTLYSYNLNELYYHYSIL